LSLEAKNAEGLIAGRRGKVKVLQGRVWFSKL